MLTEPKNTLILHAILRRELFPWYIFLPECEIHNYVDVGRHMRTASLHGWPLACYQSNNLIPPVMSILLSKSFIPSIFNCPFFVQKHLVQTCGAITLAGLRTFYQMSVFNGKTHYLYNVIGSKGYLTFPLVEHLFPPKHSLKIWWKSKHFHGDIDGNVSGCFSWTHGTMVQ